MPDIALVIITSDGGVQRFPLEAGMHVIGRDQDCDLVVDSFFVAHHHVRLTIASDHFVLTPLAKACGQVKGGAATEDGMRFDYPQTLPLGALCLDVLLWGPADQQAGRATPTAEAAGKSDAPSDESVIEGRYQPGSEIARGGMGAVIRSQDLKLGRQVAMKVLLHPDKHGLHARTRFVQEAGIMARLEHPNIVLVHDLGADTQGRPYYVMKEVRGRTLQQILDAIRKGDAETIASHPLNELLTIFLKVCDGIAFAHSKGVVHRDLKPDNIMIGEYGEVMVMDWGLAKDIRAGREGRSTPPIAPLPEGIQEMEQPVGALGLTLEGSVMGTPHYMPPEQAEGRMRDVDERSDVFSLGGILYAILTLRAPIEGSSVEELLKNVREGNITPPSSLNTGNNARDRFKPSVEINGQSGLVSLPHCPSGRVPAALSLVAMKALSVEPAQRYQFVESLSRDVEKWQAGFATSAEDIGAWGQATLLIKRHQAFSSAVAGALLIITALTGGFMFKVDAEKRTALQQKAGADEARTAAEGEKLKARTAETNAIAALAQSKIALAEAAFRNQDLAMMSRALEVSAAARKRWESGGLKIRSV